MRERERDRKKFENFLVISAAISQVRCVCRVCLKKNVKFYIKKTVVISNKIQDPFITGIG